MNEIAEKTKTLGKTTGKKVGRTYRTVWNLFIDLLYLLAIVIVVSVGVLTAYSSGVDHPAIIWAGERLNTIWMNIFNYFS